MNYSVITESALVWWLKLNADKRIELTNKHFPTLTIKEICKRHIKFIFLAEKSPK